MRNYRDLERVGALRYNQLRRRLVRPVVISLLLSGVAQADSLPAAAENLPASPAATVDLESLFNSAAAGAVDAEIFLSLLPASPETALAFLYQKLAASDLNQRSLACAGLARLPLHALPYEPTLNRLLSLAESETDLLIVLNLLQALPTAGDSRATPALVRFLAHEDRTARFLATYGLVKLRDRRAIAPIVNRLELESDPELRLAMVRALGGLAAYVELETMRRESKDATLLEPIMLELRRVDPFWEAQGYVPAQIASNPNVPSEWARAYYAALLQWRTVLQPLAVALLFAPSMALFFWNVASTRRLFLHGAGVVTAGALGLFWAAFLALPTMPAGTFRADPASGLLLLLLPLTQATSVLPVVTSASLVRISLARTPLAIALTALTAGFGYWIIQWATWSMVPLILQGNYRNYGHHPGWHQLQFFYAMGISVASASWAALSVRLYPAEARVIPTVNFGSYCTGIALALPIFGLGYLILNLYAY